MCSFKWPHNFHTKVCDSANIIFQPGEFELVLVWMGNWCFRTQMCTRLGQAESQDFPDRKYKVATTKFSLFIRYYCTFVTRLRIEQIFTPNYVQLYWLNPGPCPFFGTCNTNGFLKYALNKAMMLSTNTLRIKNTKNCIVAVNYYFLYHNESTKVRLSR